MEKFIEKNLDRIDKIGGIFGGILGKFVRFIIKHAVASVILSVFGIGVFVYAVINGAKKK